MKQGRVGIIPTNGVSVGHAAAQLAAMRRDMMRCLPDFRGTYWDDAIADLIAKMRQRARLERSWK